MNEFILSANGIAAQMQYYGAEFVEYHIMDSIWTIVIGMIFLIIATCLLWISYRYKNTSIKSDQILKFLEEIKVQLRKNKYPSLYTCQCVIDEIEKRNDEREMLWCGIGFIITMITGAVGLVCLLVGWYNYTIWRMVPIGATIQQILDKCGR